MSNYFDQFDEQAGEQKPGNYFDQFDDSPADSKQNTSTLGDLGTDLKRGAQKLPGMATGLVDVAAGSLTNRRFADELADQAGEITGFQPSKWAEEAREEYSPERQAAEAEIDQAWEEGDALDVAGAYATNPEVIAGRVAESAPQMLAGGLLGRGALAAGRAAGALQAPTTAAQAVRQAATAGAGGEGAVVAGSTMDQIDREVAPQRAAAAALGAGVGTAVLGRAGAGLAQRAGLRDVETVLAGGAQRTAADAPGLGKRLAGGAVAEGVFEELPQSVQEQMWQNFAENKALMEGTGRAAVEGALAGGAIGAGVNVLPARKPSEQMGIDPSTGPLSAAAATAVDGGPAGTQSPVMEAARRALLGGAPQDQASAPYQPADLQTAVAQQLFRTEIDETNPGALRFYRRDNDLQTWVEVPEQEAMAAAQARIQEAEQLGEDPLGQRSPQELLPEVASESGAAQIEEVEALPVFEPGESVVWANKNFDYPVEFLGFEAAPGADGRLYARVRVAGREGHVPAAELQTQAEQAPPLPTVEMDSGPQQAEQVQATPAAGDPGYEFRVQKNGRPFKGEGDVRLRKAFADAVAAGEQPVVVQHQGGWAVAVPRAPAEPAAPLALPAPSTVVVDGQGNAQRGPVEPFVEPAARVRLLGGPGMERQAPPASRVDAQANEAATSPSNQLPEPTPAQKEAGNYRKGHVRVAGLDISIENPRGSERAGRRPDGTEWRHTMSDHYGYIKRTEGADGEQVDVYLGPQEDSGQVFVVDQLNQGDGSFDEHKVMIGYPDQESAVAAYRSNFDASWKVGPVTAMSMEQFKSWLKGGDLRKPLAAPAQEQRAASKGSRRRVDRERDSLLQAVIRLGGIKTEWRQDTTGESKGNRQIPGVGALWSDKTGTSLDDMAMQLDQYGYIPAGEMDNLGGVHWLQQALRDELAGTKHFAAESAAQQEQMEREVSQRYADEQARLEQEREAEYARIEAEYGADVAAQARAYDEAAKAYDEQVLAEAQQFEDDYEQRQQQLGEIDQALTGQPLDEAGAAARDEQLRQADGREDRQQRASARPGPGQVGEPGGFDLEQQTEAGLREQAAQQQAAEQAEAEAQRQAEQKAQADRERNDFTLTGSDRPSDVGAARGQNDLFAPPTRGQRKSAEPSQQSTANKPASSRIDDVGDQLTYNRKGMFRSGGLKWADIASENDALKVKLAAKEKVWARPDWEQIVEAKPEEQREGFRLVAHLVKQVYDSLPKQAPTKSDNGIQQYIEAVTELREAAQAFLDDRAAVEKVLDALAAKAAKRMAGSYSMTDMLSSNGRNDSSPLFRALFPEQAAGKRFERGTPANDKAVALGGNKVVKALQWGTDDAVKAMKALKAGWPAKQEAWQKQGYAVVPTEGLTGRYYTDGAQVSAVLQMGGRAIERLGTYADRAQAEAAVTARVAGLDGQLLVLDKQKNLLGAFADEEAAVDFARSQTARKSEASEQEAEQGDDDWDARAGEQRRPSGRNVSEQEFMEAFGFRGVNFGKWVKQGERQRHLNAAYDGFVDLADVLGLPPRAMSLNGMLGVAFGAQGSGKNAAHFVPGVNEINITKTRGAGSLAHEWAHGLDHYFGVLGGLARSEHPFASMLGQRRQAQGDSEIRPEVAQAFTALVSAMRARTESPDEVVQRRQSALKSAKERIQPVVDLLRPRLEGNAGALAALDSLLAGDGGEYVELPIPKGKRKPIGAILSNIKTVYDALGYSSQDAYDKAHLLSGVHHASEELKKEVVARSVHTRFYKNSSALDGAKGKPYWSTQWEMFARAFESWVMDALAEKGLFNNYLVRADKQDQGDSSDAPYPGGEERRLINGAIAKLMAEIKHREPDAEGKVALYSRASYRRGPSGSEGLRAGELQGQLARLSGGWQNAPEIRVVQSIKGLPDAQRRKVELDGAFDVEGIFADGQVYLVADNLRDVKHAAFVLQHEVLGHAGLQGAYGQRLKPLLMSLYNGNAELRQQADALVQKFGYQPAVAMEEVLADMAAAGTIQQQAFWSRLVTAMRNALRSIGMNLSWSESDIQALLANARRYIVNGRRRPGAREAFSRNGRSGRGPEIADEKGRLLAPNGKPSKLNQKQWHQARSENFKRWFGNWQAVATQQRLDAMKPLKLRMPEAWKGMSEKERLAAVEAALRAMAHDQEVLRHAELGDVQVGMRGVKKAVSSSADPAKKLVLQRLRETFERSIYASSEIGSQNAPDQRVFHKALAPIDIDGVQLVAVFTVREDANGAFFYNAVTVARKDEAPVASPRDMTNEGQRSTSANTGASASASAEVGSFVRRSLGLVNPDTVSKVTDGNGEPLVLYHGTAEAFSVFEQGRAGRSTGHATAPLGIFMTADQEVAKAYAEKATDGMPGLANVMPLFASVKKPYTMSVAESQALDTTAAAIAFRQKLEREGYDGILLGDTGVWVAFYNTQVKSATNNTGAFDEIDPDIRYSRAGQRDIEALRKLGLAGSEAQNMVERVRNLTLGGLQQKLQEWAVRSEEGIFDGLAGIKRAEQAAGVTDPNRQGYVSARMASGIADVMHGVLHYAAPEWRDGIVSGKSGTRGVLEILGDLGQDNLTPWLAWLGGKRGQLLKAQGRENNLTDTDIAELLAMGKGKEELFEKVYREYAQVNEAVLDLAQEAGLIDQDARAKWLTDYYVPFYRQDEAEGIFTAPRSKRGLSHQTAAIKALKGGTLPTNDLLANMLAGWTQRIEAAMKNKALLEVVDNLKDSDFLSDESPRWQQVLISRDQIAQQIRKDRKALQLAAEMLDLPAGANVLQVVNKLMKPESEGFEKLWTRVAPTDPDIIRVQRDGKSEYYRVNDESLLRGLKFIEGSVFNDPITKIGRAFKRLLTTGVTASPDFILRNFIRDAAHAWMINKDGFTLGKDSIKGMRDALREDQDYRDLMFAGGSFQGGYVHGTDPEASAQIIRRALEKKGFTNRQQDAYLASLVNTPAKAAAMLGKGWQKYRELGDKVENANRLSTYKAAREAGKSRRQASFEAKDLMDYSLRGNFAAAQWFTDVVPFLNARLQGLYKLGRAAKGDKTLLAKEVAMKGGYIALFSLLLAGLNDDDERYQALQDWDKDMHWHIFLGDEHFRIPKPFELGLLFGTVPERLLHTLTGSQDGGDLAKAVAQGVFQTLAFNPVPQFYQPIRELQANRNFFRDAPIEDMSDEGKLPEARYDERTSALGYGVGQVTGRLFGISPKQVDHLVQGYTGTIGGYILGLSSLIASGFREGEGPDWRISDLPVAKVLYQGDAPRTSKYQAEFYDMLTEADQLHRTLKSYREEGRIAAAEDLLESNREKLRHRPALGLARRQLGNIRNQMDAIYRDAVMSGQEKRRRLDELQRRANQVAERVVQVAGADF